MGGGELKSNTCLATHSMHSSALRLVLATYSTEGPIITEHELKCLANTQQHTMTSVSTMVRTFSRIRAFNLIVSDPDPLFPYHPDFDNDPNEKLVDPDTDEVEKVDEGAVASALEADDSASWRPLTSADINAQQQQQQQQQQHQQQNRGNPGMQGGQNAPAPIPTFATQSETSNFALPPNNTRYQNQAGGNRYSDQGHMPERRHPGNGEENDEG